MPTDRWPRSGSTLVRVRWRACSCCSASAPLPAPTLMAHQLPLGSTQQRPRNGRSFTRGRAILVCSRCPRSGAMHRFLPKMAEETPRLLRRRLPLPARRHHRPLPGMAARIAIETAGSAGAARSPRTDAILTPRGYATHSACRRGRAITAAGSVCRSMTMRYYRRQPPPLRRQ